MTAAGREATSGVLLAAAPLVYVAGRAIQRTASVPMPAWAPTVLGSAAVTMIVAAALARWKPRVGRAVATAALLAFAAAVVPAMTERPSLALLVGVTWLASLVMLWPTRVRVWTRDGALAVAARTAGVGAVITWALSAAGGLAPSPPSHYAAALAQGIAILLLVRWMRHLPGHVPRPVWIALAVVPVLALLVFAGGHIGRAVSVLTAAPVAGLPFLRDREADSEGWGGLVIDHPARLVVVTFVALCAVGTLLVALPVCSQTTHSIGLIDSAFTSVSAVCVTGLIVVDTPTAFSPVGQIVILGLIQLGALGIMSLSTAALGLLGRRLSLRHEAAVAGLYAAEHRGRLYAALDQTLRVTVAFEAAGAFALFVLFLIAGDGWGMAAWRGLFTAVSAFCNAGFALQTDSLIPYQHHPGVLAVVSALIVAGGLSPPVIVALPLLWQRRRVRLHIRLVVVGTIVLLLLGTAGYAALEWENSLAGMSVFDRLVNAGFQSVTTRTAGFNSIDMGSIRTATLPLLATWMFVGGAPGGTAGGIKVTTACVLLLAVVGTLRGTGQAQIFGRRIPHRIVYEAAAITVIGVAVVSTCVMLLLLTQPISARLATFEVVSAFGTVGLSLGATTMLDGVGKVIIMIAMFLGRVGPLTAFLFLSERAVRPRIGFPEEEVEVG